MEESLKLTLYDTKSTKVCAYCQRHRVYLTIRQLRQKKCLKKNCRALVPLMSHPLWEKRAERKELRKQRKILLEMRYRAVVNRNDF